MKSPQRLILEACMPKGMTITKEYPDGADFLLQVRKVVIDVQFAGEGIVLGRRAKRNEDKRPNWWFNLNDPEILKKIRMALIKEGSKDFGGPDLAAWSAIFYATGPAKYQIAYRAKALYKKWKLNQRGLFDQDGQKLPRDRRGNL